MRKTSLIVLSVPLLLALAACRHDAEKPRVLGQPHPPESVPLPPLSSELASALQGRTIFIDPGHGGPFTGMIAPSNGIHEADVNLNVALALRERLEEQGATALLSREDDTVLVPDSLSRDLSARAAMSNGAQPDVFISVHHNADVEAGSQKDDLEVYYKLGDDMASLDLGRAMIAALSRGIRYGSSKKLLLPGNYKVLRENEAPSLLLETAYLTNDRDAAYLATPEGVDDEVRSIVYGLASYFALDPPKAEGGRFQTVSNGDDTDASTREFPEFHVRFVSGLPIDLDTITVAQAGEDCGAAILSTDYGFKWVLTGPVPNGETTYDITGRNMNGAGFRIRQTVLEDRRASRIRVTQLPDVAGSGNLVLFEVRALDSLGLPVIDDTPVTVTGTDRAVPTRGGVANIYFNAEDMPEAFTVECGGIEQTVTTVRGLVQRRTMTVQDALTREAIPIARVFKADTLAGTANTEGWLVLPADNATYTIRRDGFEETAIKVSGDAHVTVPLRPMYGGVLLGRRIAIDPAHGGRVAGVRACDGTRASDLNLDAARRLARLLKRSGAKTFVTRTGDDEITDPQRITATEAFTADLLLVISFGAPVEEIRPLDPEGHLRRDLTAFVGHYPESVNGIRAANAIARELGVQTTDCVSYMVQQSQSPAVHVQPASLDFRAPEDAPFDAEAMRRIAQAIHRGVVEYFTKTNGTS